MFRKSGIPFDEVEPGIYTVSFEGVEEGPNTANRPTVRWIFRLEDGRRVTGISSDKWSLGARRSKAVEWLEAILARAIGPDEDPDVVVAEAVGRVCRVKVTRKQLPSGLSIPTVTQIFPA